MYKLIHICTMSSDRTLLHNTIICTLSCHRTLYYNMNLLQYNHNNMIYTQY